MKLKVFTSVVLGALQEIVVFDHFETLGFDEVPNSPMFFIGMNGIKIMLHDSIRPSSTDKIESRLCVSEVCDTCMYVQKLID